MMPVFKEYNLLIDLGNTRIKWMSFVDGMCSEMMAEVYTPSLKKLLNKQWKSLPQPLNIWIASVAPPRIKNELHSWVQNQWPNIPIYFVNSTSGYKTLSNAYTNPVALGVDRWLGLIAATELYPKQATCIISAGTYITFDILNQEAKHLGGAILPGLHSFYQSLNALNPNIVLEREQNFQSFLFGASTEACTKLGLNALLEGALTHLLNESFKKLFCAPLIILTGGDAGALALLLKRLKDNENNLYSVQEEAAWVLKGLSYLCRIARPRGV